MAIPGSVLNVMFDPSSCEIMYPSLATFLTRSTSKDSAGQESHTFTVSIDPTLSNLKCRKAPLRTDRVENQKATEGNGIQRTDASYRLSIMSYVNQPVDTLLTWQISVDGVTYQIQAVEPDGSNLTTRLMIGDIVPYNG